MIRKSKLINLLNQIEGDPMILLSSDSEGNRFSPMYGYDTGFAETPDYSEYVNEKDEHNATYPVVVLYPSH